MSTEYTHRHSHNYAYPTYLSYHMIGWESWLWTGPHQLMSSSDEGRIWTENKEMRMYIYSWGKLCNLYSSNQLYTESSWSKT